MIGRCCCAADHPRSRGEYDGAFPGVPEGGGSSPLSRGILAGGGPGIPRRRIIPALAGNTSLPRTCHPRMRDHPRSRGEYTGSTGVAWLEEGSSPLSRGIREDELYEGHGGRIIPALAGNTRTGPTADPLTRDHPRSRGEYLDRVGSEADETGSSPLSRGIRHGRWPPQLYRRIIPALAGNTVT